MSIHIMTSTNCDLRESDPCRGHGRSSGRGALATNPTDSMLIFFTPRIHTVLARLGLIKEGVCFRFFGCLQDEGRNCSKCCTVMKGFTPLKIQNPRSCSSAVILPPWTTF